MICPVPETDATSTVRIIPGALGGILRLLWPLSCAAASSGGCLRKTACHFNESRSRRLSTNNKRAESVTCEACLLARPWDPADFRELVSFVDDRCRLTARPRRNEA